MGENQTALEDLKKLYDEVRVKMHLGEMEAKEWWAQVEPQMALFMDSISRQANKASASATVFIDEFSEALRRVRDRLDDEK
jgi:hypothetical protein